MNYEDIAVGASLLMIRHNEFEPAILISVECVSNDDDGLVLKDEYSSTYTEPDEQDLFWHNERREAASYLEYIHSMEKEEASWRILRAIDSVRIEIEKLSSEIQVLKWQVDQVLPEVEEDA